MIIDRSTIDGVFGSPILPKGDRYDLPPGTGQVRLVSLLVLLTVGALLAATCRWLEFGLAFTLVAEALVVLVWWQTAQLRAVSHPNSEADQTALREEVRRWLHDTSQSATLQSDRDA